MSENRSLRESFTIAAGFAAAICLIKLVESLLGLDLHFLALYPRSLDGLQGVLTAPLVHASWQHALGNAVPAIGLGGMLIYGYPKSRYVAIPAIWILSGIGVWLFGRSSYHLGASGLVHGIFFYLFIAGILRRDARSAALLMVAFYFYGGMLLTIFPRDPTISFESHFFGALAGAGCAWVFRDWDPKPWRRRYSWERSPGEPLETEEEDPVIGDQWREER